MLDWKCVGGKRHLENRHPHEGCNLQSMAVLKPHFQGGITHRMPPVILPASCLLFLSRESCCLFLIFNEDGPTIVHIN